MIVDLIPSRSKKSSFIEVSQIGCGTHLFSYPVDNHNFLPRRKVA